MSRKRGGSCLFLPASKALLLGISTGVFEQSMRKWSESRALATIARARVVPSGRPTSHLGDRHLDWETDISSHTSRRCAVASTCGERAPPRALLG